MVKKDDILDLEVIDLDNEGRGVAKGENSFVVFVKNGIPGDKVKANILIVRKNFAEAKLLEVIEPSVFRTDARCEHFGTCNGCKMQDLNYDAQLRIKQQHIIDVFERIGGFKNLDIPDVTGGEPIYFYRNKLEFSFSNNRWINEGELSGKEFGIVSLRSQVMNSKNDSFALGYHMPNFVDKVLDIKNCYLQSEVSNKILTLTRDFFKKRNTGIYSFKTHTGYLRYLVIKNSQGTREILVNLITSNEKDSLINEYAKCLKDEITEVTTLTNSIATTKAQASIGDYYKVIFGSGFIEEHIGKYKFKITPNIFFQTNSKQTQVLFDKAVHFAQFEGNENVLDLYCGCGVISIYISSFVSKVTGVESNKEAIEAAKENAEMNSIKNTEFIEFDVKDYLKSLQTSERFHYDTVILDPPRSGIHPKAAEYLLKLVPGKIIYVSCNPSTQARDLKILVEKYDITGIQPVDMFPHTMHTENVVALRLRSR